MLLAQSENEKLLKKLQDCNRVADWNCVIGAEGQLRQTRHMSSRSSIRRPRLMHGSCSSLPIARRIAVAITALLSVAGTALQAQTPVHPLDQLSAKEHWAIYDALQAPRTR